MSDDAGLSVMHELVYASACELAKLIRTKQVSSEEVVRQTLARIHEINPRLNAVVQLSAEALEQARQADRELGRGTLRGPLHGVPVTTKETWSTTGMVWSGGTLGRAKLEAQQDATVVSRMRAAGAISLGQTNVPELALAYETDNLVYGRTHNPYDVTRTPGGSGGGGAAAIASGGSALEIGADTAGSIRLPSHFCGIAGIRPTTGRVPLTGYFPPLVGILSSISAAGPMARRIEDLQLALSIVSGPDGHDPETVLAPIGDPASVDVTTLRIAFYTDNGIVSSTPETVGTVQAAALAASKAGARVEEARPPGTEHSLQMFLGLFAGDGGAGVQALLEMSNSSSFHPLMEQLLQFAQKQMVSVQNFTYLLAQRDILRRTLLDFASAYDAIISPVCAVPAVPHGTSFHENTIPAFSYSTIYSLSGWPAAVVRCGTSPEGLPIGVQIAARPWREDIALAVASYLESSLGGWRMPPLDVRTASPGQSADST